MSLVYWTLFETLLVQVLMCLFLKGYFPLTQHEKTVIDPPKQVLNVSLNPPEFYQPQIDRLVLVIIDALRYDFITSDHLPHLHEKMHCIQNMKVEAPTVTLPRIKALMTGGVPQYIDIVLNLGATSKVEDSFIHQAHKSGKKILFYGDNTWLSMFPELFARSEGTTSFFVTDYTEVDSNVTRHVQPELLRHDWDILILHYLGLDHIGHVRGPFSSLIKPKLREMDKVLNTIITSAQLWDERTLLIITGDHGMKDSGGHGGTSYAETHVPMVLWQNKLHINCSQDTEIPQTNVANTLSALFGLAMPATSVGTFLPHLFRGENRAQLLYISYYNSIILQRISNKCEDEIQYANINFAKAVKSQDFNGHFAKEAYDQYQYCLKLMSEHIIATSVQQDLYDLLFALVSSINAFIGILHVNFECRRRRRSMQLHYCAHILNGVSVAIFILLNYSLENTATAYFIILMLCQSAIFVVNIKSFILHLNITLCMSILCNCFPLFIHASLLLASSFIEFEEEIFFFFMNTFFLLLSFASLQTTRKLTFQAMLPLLGIEIIRICRAINAHWLISDENMALLKLWHIFALISTFFTCNYFFYRSKRLLIQQPIILSLIFVYKFYYERSITFAQFIWLLIGSQMFRQLSGIPEPFHRFLNVFILVIIFLLRAHNTILVPGMIICSRILVKHVRNPFILTLSHTYLGYTFFFLQGHSNSIASIDLAPGYIGLSSYVPFIVVFLTVLHCYAFQCLGMLLLQCTTNLPILYVLRMNLTIRVWILIVIYCVVFIQRGHLFIWSVFAPKLLIECSHTFVLCVQIVLYCVVAHLKTYRNKVLFGVYRDGE